MLYLPKALKSFYDAQSVIENRSCYEIFLEILRDKAAKKGFKCNKHQPKDATLHQTQKCRNCGEYMKYTLNYGYSIGGLRVED
tara:strand:+ start:103 stop:351 length:249 start_codon:yes stop_codon:yes gene_type:complete